jgi:ADP-dependent NAD(P)H-hydrate dehydratase / NAD(P)H-hydrate epimerase
MDTVTIIDVKNLVLPDGKSHKGQNGKLLIIGGSHLFHAASLWALTVASRIVDLVHYSSTTENNEHVQQAKKEFRNGIVIARSDVDAYIEEDDCILIGPGMTRDSETEELTNRLLQKHFKKQWVIDAGALQMMNLDLIPQGAILTPHGGEFELLVKKNNESGIMNHGEEKNLKEHVKQFAQQYHCIVLLKGQVDIVSNGKVIRQIEGGNAGMTKGGTGDVLAGLIAALACKSDPFTATIAGSFINKKAGDALYTKVGPFFNATDLAGQIPLTMKELLI